MTFPVDLHRVEPDPRPEPILASALTANIALMNQMTTTEVWSDDDDDDR